MLEEIRNQSTRKKGDGAIYALACALGICAGALDARLGDLLLTAVFVLCSTMVLGALRPRRPWRWILVVGIWVPILQLLAYLFLTEKPYTAQIYESFLGFLTGIAGAYCGALARMAMHELFGTGSPGTKTQSGPQLSNGTKR